ncbi:MAG: aminotransferase class I/II-fold pyridoxal phosphate-dependent enzyme [Chloroflexota bacterium]|nr:MAG: aminotransferase class I/II-fold pyridoxal phosphate-dependent enzyme [Chloroflexota bacterium]
MPDLSTKHGLSTLVNHYAEGSNPHNAHIMPIYQTSLFSFPDHAAGAAIYNGSQKGYTYTRAANPNADHFAKRVAMLEALDILGEEDLTTIDTRVVGKAFASGMAAISAAILARVKTGEVIIAQESLYSNAYNLLSKITPRLGIEVVWVRDTTAKGWQAALRAHPNAVLLYTETPANPTMMVIDLAEVGEIAHDHGSWLMVDNTFATPYCQRPLSFGADVVVHSSTKYLSGHGVIIGGLVISKHLDYMQEQIPLIVKTLGGAPSPFDTWLANLGLKTFELRMQRHCENAMGVAQYLDTHPAIAQVNYPGLRNDKGNAIAVKQMTAFGGMLSFDLKGGLEAGERLMNRLKIATLGVSLGNVDSLIQHPASMTHVSVPPADRLKMGISDGLVRFSVGIENLEDIIADLDQGLKD